MQPDTDGKVELEFPKVFKGNQSNFEALQTKAIQEGFTGEELASFLAQTKHESDKFNSIVERVVISILISMNLEQSWLEN